MKRFFISTGVAVAVVFTILLLMTKLIQQDAKAVSVTEIPDFTVDIPKPKPEKPKERRKLPKKKQLKKQPSKPETITETKIKPVSELMRVMENPGAGSKLVSLGGSGASQDQILTPIVTIEPMYPGDALRDGKQGWVTLSFNVSKDGTVNNVRVVKAKPSRIFNRAAMTALYKWKFRPEMVSGQAVEVKNQEVTLEFNIED